MSCHFFWKYHLSDLFWPAGTSLPNMGFYIYWFSSWLQIPIFWTKSRLCRWSILSLHNHYFLLLVVFYYHFVQVFAFSFSEIKVHGYDVIYYLCNPTDTPFFLFVLKKRYNFSNYHLDYRHRLFHFIYFEIFDILQTFINLDQLLTLHHFGFDIFERILFFRQLRFEILFHILFVLLTIFRWNTIHRLDHFIFDRHKSSQQNTIL